MTELEPPPDRSWIEFETRREVPNVLALTVGMVGICLAIIALALLVSLP